VEVGGTRTADVLARRRGRQPPATACVATALDIMRGHPVYGGARSWDAGEQLDESAEVNQTARLPTTGVGFSSHVLSNRSGEPLGGGGRAVSTVVGPCEAGVEKRS
jgi:hypothetical protein